ncbi:GNAT family N-acetyltransferase [Variovorax terrae]|uniref:GNAT family N-acetyltransferase n=1 Tax=Variovorax terrae TaxID=2923278 RepID=A0A9X1VUW2_9BURK|nr:GNAT family protein [Variovorax terrae]MCJ0764276.1 GNAT family N-acetyltransferase [Variovorax terrae]
MPELLIEGAKVALRRFSAGDIGDDYLGWLNDPLLMRYSNQRFAHHNRQSSLRYLASFEDSPNFFLSVRDRANDRLLGTMTAYVSPHHGTADMGILIGAAEARGRGVGLDAWCTLMAWLLAKQGLRKVTAGTLACNTSMLRLVHDSGMEAEGVRRQQEIVNGAPQDILYFARFRDA